MINDNKFVFQYFGQGIALGLGGAKEEVSNSLNLLYNYGSHKDQITWLSDTFGYVLTTKKTLIKGVSNIVFQDYLKGIDEPRGFSRQNKLLNARNQADEWAATWVGNLPLENFLNTDKSVVTEYAIPFR